MFDTTDKDDGFLKNFAIMIPKGPFKTPKKKKVSFLKKVLCFVIGHKWGFAGISYMGPSFPRKCKRCKVTKWFDKPTIRMRFGKWADKTLDKLWKPLCAIGLHRWKSHYGYCSWSYGDDNSTPEVHQHIYKCSCCKKTKTVDVK